MMIKTSHNALLVNQQNEIENEGKNFSKHRFPVLALIFVIVMLLLVNVGCTPTLAAQNAVAEARSGDVLFFDDFSDPPSGWGLWTRDGASVEYHNGGLRIMVNETQYDFWSVAGKNFTDVQLEVDAVKIAGPDDNDFGLVCRYQNKDNFYMLVASNDGYYGVAKMKAGVYSMIGYDQLQYNNVIAQGQALNHLSARCVGPKLSLYANGQLLVEVEDADFSSGDVGLIAGAYNTQGVDILFDNFMVKKP